MYVYPEGCSWGDDSTVYTSSKQEFQFEKVVAHDKPEEACQLLETDNTFQIKLHVTEIVPKDKTSPNWDAREEYVMCQACQKKFHTCSHVHEALLSSKSELVEGTFDLK